MITAKIRLAIHKPIRQTMSRLVRFGLGLSACVMVAGASVLSLSANAALGDISKNISSDIYKVLTGGGHVVTQGVVVMRLSDGKVLFEKDADKLLAPASLTKVLTSAAVLTRLTPVHTFATPLYYTGTRKGGKITGDLVVVGNGDPFLVSEKLWQMAADLRNLGVREFTGNLIIDNSLFDDESRDESREEGRVNSRHAYDAPVSAFGVNFNTYAVSVAPGDHVGQAALSSLDPYPLPGVQIENKARTSAHKDIPPKGHTVSVARHVGRGAAERLSVTGNIALGAPVQKIYRSVADDLLASGEYVRAFLNHEGIVIRGVTKSGIKPVNATLLYEIESYEMRRIVAGLNTFSNNFIADVLVKRLGAAFPRKGAADAPGSGSYANGMEVLREFLTKDVGIKTEFTLENGSGLATENRLTARQIGTVLSYMEKHMEVFPEFLASLPATGWDGTLKKRFHRGDTEDLQGLIRAKTGTLTEPIAVSGIAGYFRHPTQGLVAFCVVENGKPGQRQPSIVDLRERQDRVLTEFLNDL